MKKIIFLCEGNICRSPTAEFILKYLLQQEHLEDRFDVSSNALILSTSGRRMYEASRSQLALHHIPYDIKKEAVPLTKAIYDSADLVIYMENYHRILLKRRLFNCDLSKTKRLLDYTDKPGDIADPYSTGDFVTAYNEIYKGCEALLEALKKERK